MLEVRFPTVSKLCIVIVCIVGCVNSLSSERDLVQSLLANYQPAAKPIGSFGSSMDISFSLFLRKIHNLDEQKQIFKGNAYILMGWFDDYLYWNESETEGQTMVTVNLKKIWTPSIYVLNAVGDEAQQIVSVTGEGRVYSHGQITAVSIESFSTSCTVNLRLFPFDKQSCVITYFMPFPTTHYRLTVDEDIRKGKSPAHLTFEPNTGWDNVKTTFTEYNITYDVYDGHSESLSAINVTVTMSRVPTFYIVYLLVPSILISFVSVMVFALPPESGERIGLSITSLLSYTVFLLMVSDVTPKGGTNLPILVFYITLMECYTSLSLAFNIGIIKLFHRPDDDKIPDWIQHYLLNKLGTSLGIIDNHSGGKHSKQISVAPALGPDDHGSTANIKQEKSDNLSTRNNWVNVSKVLDKTCLIFSVLLVFFSTIIMLILLSVGID